MWPHCSSSFYDRSSSHSFRRSFARYSCSFAVSITIGASVTNLMNVVARFAFLLPADAMCQLVGVVVAPKSSERALRVAGDVAQDCREQSLQPNVTREHCHRAGAEHLPRRRADRQVLAAQLVVGEHGSGRQPGQHCGHKRGLHEAFGAHPSCHQRAQLYHQSLYHSLPRKFPSQPALVTLH